MKITKLKTYDVMLVFVWYIYKGKKKLSKEFISLNKIKTYLM